MFTDQVVLELHAGKGGNGIVAWRREKYIRKGGPYGGDGGQGASIFIETDPEIYSLEAFRNRRILKAENGQQGGSNNRKGRNGRDCTLKVPCGTLVKDAKTGELLHDLIDPYASLRICKGGNGGRGNTAFKSPTNRAPNYATPGRLGERLSIELELKLIADVGLIGFPNVGKSTLFSQITQVPVKIAPYPFTTLRPNLGYHFSDLGERILLADIPGILAGAHQNRGLGLEFLRHIERTHLLLFVLDASGFEGVSPLEAFQILKQELLAYESTLLEKPCGIVLNKMDLEGASHQAAAFVKAHPHYEVFTVSAKENQGLEAVVGFLKRKLNK